MGKLPPTYDVGKLASQLLKRSQTREAGRAIEQLLDTASAHTDLSFALELLATIFLDAAGEIEHPTPYSNAVRGALLGQAILLYARATIVENARRTFDIRKHLTPEQLEMHNSIKDMRHSAIAHFDRASSFRGKKWADEFVVLPSDLPFRLVVAIRRMIVDDELVRSLMDQTETAHAILGRLRGERQARARELLFGLLEAQPWVGKLINAYPIDLEHYFSRKYIDDMLGAGLGAGGELHPQPTPVND